MKQKEIISAHIYMDNGKTYVKLRNENQVTSLKVLLNILDEFRVNRDIVSGKMVQRDNFINYIYEVKTGEEEKTKDCLFVVKIKKSEKDLYHETIKYLDSLCDLSVTLKKVNTARILAGIIAGLFVLINAGPHIAKGLANIFGETIGYEHELTDEQQEEMKNIMHEGIYYPTEEEKKEAEEWYYEHIDNDNLLENEKAGKTM